LEEAEEHYSTAIQRTMESNVSNKDGALPEKLKTPFIFGNPLQVYEQLQALQAIYQANEIMILTNIPDYEIRRNSYQLIAQTCL
jgi:alkanesulfonate monooxygenase SsuD/methylene tetrahydromethanopterin reductase-like flavin-dependent oxidoreductase (luciferase family)